jgi:hypothetical protein
MSEAALLLVRKVGGWDEYGDHSSGRLYRIAIRRVPPYRVNSQAFEAKDSSPHKVNHLQAVPCVKGGLGPGTAGGDVAVVFDCDAIALKAQFGDELFEGRGLGERIEGTGLPIEDQGKWHGTFQPSRSIPVLIFR